MTCSVGYSHYPLGPFGVLSVEDVLRVVNAAAYLAKAAGRDRVVGIDTGELGVTQETSAMIREDAAIALRSGHLRLYETASLEAAAAQSTSG